LYCVVMSFVFFCSSRRRHTRFSRDWSSDVCSSDLRAERGEDITDQDREFHRLLFADLGNEMLLQLFDLFWLAYHRAAPTVPRRRSEERRVGEERRRWTTPAHARQRARHKSSTSYDA